MKWKNERLRALELFSEGYGKHSVASRLGLSTSTVKRWLYAYRAIGSEALTMSSHRHYDHQTKVSAASDFLDGRSTKPEIMERYGIASSTALDRWVREYREGGPDALLPKSKGRPRKVTTTYANRVEELEARVRELELEVEIQKRINA